MPAGQGAGTRTRSRGALSLGYHPSMLQRLRHSTWAARVLATFAICLIANLVGSLVAPTSVQQICSATKSVKVVVAQADGTPSADARAHGDGHCPLCAVPVLPTDSPRLPSFRGGIAHFSVGIPAARLAALVGAPLPPRGPPVIA